MWRLSRWVVRFEAEHNTVIFEYQHEQVGLRFTLGHLRVASVGTSYRLDCGLCSLKVTPALFTARRRSTRPFSPEVATRCHQRARHELVLLPLRHALENWVCR